MKQRGRASRIWFGLFGASFIIVVSSVTVLLRQQIGTETANAQFEELQSEVNSHADEEFMELIYDAQPTGTVQIEQEEETLQEERTEVHLTSAKSAAPVDQESGETVIEAVQKDVIFPDISGGETKQETKPTVQSPAKTLDWEALHSQNPDIYAWIYVPDTGVDYPVVQHPTDNSYYLNHNMDGSKGYPGCIYTENFNRRDFSDIHTVLYGHNLKDKTMFSTLHNFENEELFQKEHYIYLYTEDSVFAYQIFAAYEFSAIHLLDNFDYSNEYVYEDYLKQIRQAAGNIRQDVEVTAKDKIITLSTCTADHDADRRFLVTGVLVN